MRNLVDIIHETIDEKERKGWDKFVSVHKKHGIHVSGNGISLRISGDSVGGYTIVMKCSCGKEKNITNFDHW